MAEEIHFDCLILGAGISGLDAAYHIQKHCKWANYAILERRANLGGTWDFFKYPGIRSDSDMYTFGFSWKIWKSAKPIAPAEDILAYLKEAAEEQGIMKNIHFKTDIQSADWKSSDNRWHLVTTNGHRYSCNVLFGCTGYYSYETPYEPGFPGQKDFKGTVIHPQKWTKEHDKEIVGKKIAIIGSGATAVTILPNIADLVSHVTMVQRTPTYIGAKPEVDPVAQFFNTWLPARLAQPINRWKAVLLGFFFYLWCTTFPNKAKKFVKGVMYNEVKSVMSVEEFDKHFTPPYNPWQQRFCLAPGGDFFKPIRDRKATMVTGHIDRFTETGILMKDGQHVDADFIIAATGLTMQQNFPFSTIKVNIDGQEYKAAEHLIYNAVMISDVPNFGFIIGYTNASWTLKADIASKYFTKVLNYMRDNRVDKLMPKENEMEEMKRVHFTGGLTSGYFARAGAIMPKQGDKPPWDTAANNYLYDLFYSTFKGMTLDSLEITAADKFKKDS